jgi:hypothetical protein
MLTNECIHHFDEMFIILTKCSSFWPTYICRLGVMYINQSKFVKMMNTFVNRQTYGCHLGDMADEPIFVILTK